MRVALDCSEVTGGTCSFAVAGEEDQVLAAALAHGAGVHGLSDNSDTRAVLQSGMRRQTDRGVRGYGTTMIGRLAKGTIEEFGEKLRQWEEERHVPGFLGAQSLVAADGTVVNTAVFRDRLTYDRLADDPAQDEWYQRQIAPMLDGDPTWIDGEWDVYYRGPAIQLPQQTSKHTAST